MRSPFLIVLIFTLLFSGWSFYKNASPCIVPLHYSLGEIDSRFGIDTSTVESILAESEAIWEDALGRELFVLDSEAAFKINFNYDERQSKSDSAEIYKENLDKKEAASATIRAQYEKLITEYESLRTDYDKAVSAYKKKLAEFDATVAQHNENGGAPAAEFAELKRVQKALDTEGDSLEQVSQKLTDLSRQINEVADKDKALVSDYNAGVEKYNKAFTGGEEFTQGDYQGDSIHIYHFKDKNELRNVLVHELGHAIGLSHVESSQSIMYYLMEDQPTTSELSQNDLEALATICAPNDNFIQKLHSLFSSLFIKLNLL